MKLMGWSPELEGRGRGGRQMTQRRLAGLGLALALVASAPDAGRDPAIGRSYQIPYRLTETNHALVRVRIDGKGPFNFLVDTGAPALYVGTEAARKAGLEPPGRASSPGSGGSTS